MRVAAVSVGRVGRLWSGRVKKAAARIQATYGDCLDLRPISNDQVVTVRGNTVRTVTA
jgi:hypothetical protein